MIKYLTNATYGSRVCLGKQSEVTSITVEKMGQEETISGGTVKASQLYYTYSV